MSESTRFAIPADHPALPGHFPGNPLVPGVVLLDHVMSWAEERFGCAIKAIDRVKFLSPLRPDEVCILEATASGAQLRLSCRVGDRAVMSALVVVS